MKKIYRYEICLSIFYVYISLDILIYVVKRGKSIIINMSIVEYIPGIIYSCSSILEFSNFITFRCSAVT